MPTGKIPTDPQRRRRPSIEAMRALVAFHDAKQSVSHAARILELSQPVVSTKLKVFEDHDATGAVLISRPETGRSFQLTDAGQAAIPGMRELIRQYDHLLAFLSGTAEGPLLVRIATGSFAAEHILPPALTAIRRIVEACDIRTFVARGRERILGVASGEYDLAIVNHSRDQIRDTLREANYSEDAVDFTELASLPLFVAAAPDTDAGRVLRRMKKNDTVPIDRLTQWELVGLDRRSGLRRRLEQKNPRESPLYFQIEGGGWNASREYAKAGLGVAIAPAAVLLTANKSELVIRRLSRSFQSTESVIHRSQTHLRPEHEEIIGTLTRSATKLACGQL